MKKVIFIGCVKEKRPGQHPAAEKYTSTLFTKALAWAKQQESATPYILSAKYGLLELEDRVDDYDLTLTNFTQAQNRAWGAMVQQQLRQRVDPSVLAIFLAGETYRRNVADYFTQWEAPMQHLGIGQQMAWLSQQGKPVATTASLWDFIK